MRYAGSCTPFLKAEEIKLQRKKENYIDLLTDRNRAIILPLEKQNARSTEVDEGFLESRENKGVVKKGKLNDL